MMISYVTLGVSDIAAARKFYGELLGELGAKTLLTMDRITFFGKSMQEPMLAVCIPFNQQPASAGNGSMVSFAAGSKTAVDALYQKAIALGASCDGAPGQRIPDMFYGAYVRDADGNKLCFCHFG
jgi:predicted lactoylglutathione lyase